MSARVKVKLSHVRTFRYWQKKLEQKSVSCKKN